jgi:hypothetical protein
MGGDRHVMPWWCEGVLKSIMKGLAYEKLESPD